MAATLGDGKRLRFERIAAAYVESLDAFARSGKDQCRSIGRECDRRTAGQQQRRAWSDLVGVSTGHSHRLTRTKHDDRSGGQRQGGNHPWDSAHELTRCGGMCARNAGRSERLLYLTTGLAGIRQPAAAIALETAF